MNSRARGGWFRLMTGSGLMVVVLMGGSAFSPFDREALGYSVLVAAGVAVAWWRPRVGAAVLGALFLNALVWMIPSVVGNLQHHGPPSATLLPGAIAISAAAGTVAALGCLFRRQGGRGALLTASIGVVVLVVLVVSAGPGSSDAAPADIEMETRDMAFLPSSVSVVSGEVSVRVRNHDLFWHTFTIPELDVDVTLPARAERSRTFSAPAGTYEFVCTIPGHTRLGMRGTLLVR